MKQYTLCVSERPFRYHIRQWLALNEDNYATYTRLSGMLERIALLQQILQNQLVGLLHQLNYQPERPIEVAIQNLKEECWVDYKKIKVLAYSLEFTCNLALPDYIGLGKGCSTGWGVMKGLRAVEGGTGGETK